MKAENDEQILQLIGDALRDGPGTPAWVEAVRLIDAEDGQELEGLYRVRERLESGKRWRQVRPGVGFTRKIMEAVEQQSDASVRPTGPATIIAVLCGLLIVVILAALLPMLFSRAKAPPVNSGELDNIYFSTPWLSSDFGNVIGGDWTVTGNTELIASHGVHAKNPSQRGAQWGITSVQTLGADQFFAFEVKLDVPADGTIAQIFITDQKNEIAAVVDASHVQVVLPGNQSEFTGSRPSNASMQIRWLIGPASAALEVDGKRVWAGANDLTSGRARSIGVRFVLPDHAGPAAGIENVDVRTKS